jgi:5-dehydro-4-deoxyglucarate dehydratase
MARHPFCALVIAGGAGELYSLAPNEIEAIVRVAVRAVNGRMPVIAGTGYGAAVGSDIARRAERAGADALLVLPPYYTGAPLPGLVAYYEEIARATALPLIVYSRDSAVLQPREVAHLCDRVPSIGGWKDGQPDLRLLRRVMSQNAGRLAFYGGMGDDFALEYRAVGAQAFTSSLSNVVPRLALELATAEFDRARELLAKYVQPFFEIRSRMRGYEVSLAKAAMELAGATAGPVRPPLPSVRPADLDNLRVVLDSYSEFL